MKGAYYLHVATNKCRHGRQLWSDALEWRYEAILMRRIYAILVCGTKISKETAQAALEKMRGLVLEEQLWR